MNGYATMTASRKRGTIQIGVPNDLGAERGVQFWAVSFFGWRNGMDPRVCAASLRSLLALG
ncbi:MAG: hypothetical protein E5X43_06155 [Mesorhizobium sp.]|nr:MAG: hypothetical protein E5X43_06155 [Mesorhizobium sp.]